MADRFAETRKGAAADLNLRDSRKAIIFSSMNFNLFATFTSYVANVLLANLLLRP